MQCKNCPEDMKIRHKDNAKTARCAHKINPSGKWTDENSRESLINWWYTIQVHGVLTSLSFGLSVTPFSAAAWFFFCCIFCFPLSVSGGWSWDAKNAVAMRRVRNRNEISWETLEICELGTVNEVEERYDHPFDRLYLKLNWTFIICIVITCSLSRGWQVLSF